MTCFALWPLTASFSECSLSARRFLRRQEAEQQQQQDAAPAAGSAAAAAPTQPSASASSAPRARPSPCSEGREKSPATRKVAPAEADARRAAKQRKRRAMVDAVRHLTGVGAVQISLNDRRVTASIAAIDETSGYAVAVYTEAHGRPTPVHGAVAMPLGLISEVCHKDIKKRRRKLTAAAGAAAKCQPLHAPEHFAAHDGELGRVIRGSAATAQDCRLAQPTLVGFTCDELMQKTLTDHVVFHDKWTVRAFHVRMYPLGGDDRMACDALMGGALRCAAAAEHVGVLSADGTSSILFVDDLSENVIDVHMACSCCATLLIAARPS